MQMLPSNCNHLIPMFTTILLEVFVVDAEHLIDMIIVSNVFVEIIM